MGTQTRKREKSTEGGKAYTRCRISKVTLTRICDKENGSLTQFFETAKIGAMRFEPQRKRRELKIHGRERRKLRTQRKNKGQAE